MKRPSYNELIKERRRIVEKLTAYPMVLRGTIRTQGNICGMPGCRCKRKESPVLHGPYEYLSHRYRHKSQSILLSKGKLPYAKAWIQSYKKLIRLVYRLSEINFRLLRYHYDKLGSPE